MLWFFQIFECTVDLKEGNNLDSSLCSNSYFAITTSLICFAEILTRFFQLSKKVEDFFSTPASGPRLHEAPGTSNQH